MLNVGMVGVGAISGIYLENLTKCFRDVRLVAVCDLIRERAENAVQAYKVPKIYDTMWELFADPEIDIVLNLTRPYEHFDVTKGALEAGKHVYSEKPLATTFEEGKQLVELAKSKGLYLGGAPDTFMGAGIQTCRKLIDAGCIGKPIGAAAYMICHGHESWHPDPEFYYKHGGGPMMDMGPYYVTALINLLGGVKSVMGEVQTSFAQRMITSEPHCGEMISVDVPTTVNGILEFEAGFCGTITTTFDYYDPAPSNIYIYGTEGTMMVPDPNTFGGSVMVHHFRDSLKEMPLMFDYAENSRGLGLADMARAIETGREGRTLCDQTLHVLEVMTAFEKSSKEGRRIEMETHYTRKIGMKNNPLHGMLD